MSSRNNAGPALQNPLDIIWREPEPGYWLLYARRAARLVPARIWLCDHAPYEPENKRDRWPASHLAGEIAGRWVDDIADIWSRVLLGEQTSGQHWSCAYPIVPQEGLTVEEEYLFRMSVLEHERKRGISPTRPIAKLRELELPF